MVKSKNGNKNSYRSSGIVNLKLKAWIVNMDDGSGSFDVGDIENFMDEVVSHFVDVDIIIDVCVNQLNNSEIYNSQVSSERWFSDDCSSLHMTILDTSVPGATGAALRGSNEAWTGIYGTNNSAGYNYTDVTRGVHEIGHMLGLAHTFDRNCPGSSKRECSSQYCQFINSDDLADYEIDEGDGLCDTPANQRDGCVAAFITTNCTSAPTGVLDGCNQPYNDPSGFVVTQNFMNYTLSCRQSFTKGQQLRMHKTIMDNHSGRMGEFSSCNSVVLENIFAGSIKDQVIEYEDLDLTLDIDLEIENSTVWLRNCNLKFSNEFISKITMSNSTLYLVDGSTIESAENCFGDEGNFQGIEMISGTNFFSSANGCEITGTNPFLNSSNGKGFVFGRDLTINATRGTAIESSAPILVYGNNNTINGSIEFGAGAVPHFAEYAIVLRDSKVKFSFGGTRTGIDCGTASIYLWNTEVSGFRTAIESLNGGVLSLDRCLIQSGGDDQKAGVDVTNALNVTVNNCRFDEANLKLVNTAQYSVTYNEFFDDCGFNCTKVLFDNGVDANHIVQYNVIENGTFGMTSLGNSETQFLCNEFQESSVRNFYWDKVNTLQGFDVDIASGNLFSTSTSDEVGGTSIAVTYNYFEPNDLEVLDIFSNFTGINPVFASIEDANCGLIGANWQTLDPDCPVGINCDEICPDGIDCDEPCPEGIDCTEPCPEGIDCTTPCPPNIDCSEPCLGGPMICTPHCPDGIDCTIPCPEGIDCTEPCPDGIDCNNDCPDGIDCTKDCPDGIDCFKPCPNNTDCTIPCINRNNVIGNCNPVRPEYDPVLELVELEYQNLVSERSSLEESLYSTSDELSNYLANDDVEPSEIIRLVKNTSGNGLSPNVMRRIFAFSHLFYESEMVSLLNEVPLTMYDNDINNSVFHSESFSASNIERLNMTYSSFSSSDEVSTKWKITKLDKRIYELVKYATKRLISYGASTEDEVNFWLSRLNDVNTSEILASNLASKGGYSQARNILSDTNRESKRFNGNSNESSEFINYLEDVEYFEDSINNLSEINLEKLLKFANSDSKTTMSSAQAYLEKYYDINNDISYANRIVNEKLLFINSDIEENSNREIVTAFPNPSSSGDFKFINYENSILELKIYNSLGKNIYTGGLTPDASSTIQLGNVAGHYIYTISNRNGEKIKEDKLIIVN